MSIPIPKQNQTIHRLARELRDADYQLQLAILRRQTLQADLEAAKAQRRNEADEAAAVAAVIAGLAGEWGEA